MTDPAPAEKSRPELTVLDIKRTPRGEAEHITVSLEDSTRPGLQVRFDYALIVRQLNGPVGIHVEGAAGQDGTLPRLGVAILRDLPIARWERVARLAATVGPLDGLTYSHNVKADAERLVRSLHPGVDPRSGKAGARRWRRLTKLAEVSLAYYRAQMSGVHRYAEAVAEERDVAPATVRSWIFQAQREGITTEIVWAFLSAPAQAASNA
ncbi:hypothetical protein ACIBQ3_32675 [Streptomyces rubiginosohelvolus]|uniref:hypothetical protein n=1 Tax=Streptomyces rubiginosohelvolus TaxID=67362 RepID=UPI00379E5F04